MEKRLASAAERYLNSRHQNKRRTQVMRVLAVMVVLVTVSALIMPAVTMSNEVECGLEEHTHTDSCYTVQMAAPQPELACTAGASGETLIHTHDSYCYNVQGELICTLPELEAHVHGPECYQERRELTCQEIQDLGHTHTGSCYAYEKGGLTCGLEEGGGHVHTPECYPVERSEVPLCGQEESEDVVDEATGQVLVPGHRHTSECWERRVDSMLVCGREESDDVVDEATGEVLVPGHHHGPECWLSGDELCYQRGCGQHEGQGHTHTEECYGWAQTEPLCGEVERPAGHIHDDSCYNITQVLTCHIPELEPHTHDAGCYTEGGVLICGRPEAAVHQHTEACFTTSEGGPEETRVLTCGKEEHTHTDLCYVRAEPEETETFYCGLEEHIHSLEECYFPSGALKCTLGEHVHDASCMIPPVEESDGPLESDDPLATDDPLASQDPAESGEPEPSESMEPERQEFWVEESIPYQTDAFQVTFQVKGWVKPALDSQEPAATDNETWVNDFGPGAVSTPSYEEGLVELVSQNIPLGALPVGYSASLDPDAMPGADPFAEYNQPAAEPGPAGPVGSVVEDNRPGVPDNLVPINPEVGNEPVVTPTPTVEPDLTPIPEASFEPTPTPEAEEQLELVVEQLEENDPEYQRVAANAQTELGEEESTVVDVLRVAFYAGSRKMDLSDCEVTAVIEATQEMKDAMEAQAAMTADENDPLPGEDGESQEDEEASFVMTDEQGGVLAFAKVSEPMVVTLSDEIMALSAVSSPADPKFTVEYYAYLDTANLSSEGTVGQQPEVIVTTGGTLPTNSTMATSSPKNIMYLDRATDGTINTTNHVQPIYRTHKFNYLSAPGMQYINIVTNNLQNDADGAQILPNYTLDEVWMPIAEGSSVDTEHGWSEVPQESLPEGDTGRWQKIKWNEDLHFTNRPKTVEDDPDHYVLIEDGAHIRLVYQTKSSKKGYPTNFYDYDITDGKRYTDEDRKYEGTNGTYLNSVAQGINSSENYGTGSKLAFGNNNTGTGLGNEEITIGEKEYYINRANTADREVFRFCSFGLVTGMNADGGLVYRDGITAPNLFGGGTMPKGRSDHKGQLNFIQKGDTYTLTSAAVGGGGSTGLEKLKYERPNWNKTLYMFSNDFWPMDNVSSAGTAGHDPLFGQGKYTMPHGDTDPKSDYPDVADLTKKNLHNPYFGMKYAVDFTLTEDYVGPLEYIFFGDDDMWVFLTNTETGETKLICDIGGVHNSVGEYVDLWDHVKSDGYTQNPGPVDTTELGEGETYSAKSTKYRLTFYYTERGASGSTCWMQFTLPTAVGVDLEDIIKTKVDEDHGALVLEKKTTIDTTKKFEFTLRFEGLVDYREVEITRLDSSGQWIKEERLLEDGESKWYLGKDEKLLITKLPKGVTYTITETPVEGYAPSYTVENKYLGELEKRPADFPKDIPSTQGNSVSGTIQGLSSVAVTYTNTASYELPATGGAGPMYTMACVPLLAAACLWYKKKSKGEEAAL